MLAVFLLAMSGLSQDAASVLPPTKPLRFEVVHDGSFGETLQGRLYVMLTQRPMPPIGGPNWFNPEPFFAIEVENWKAGETIVVGDDATGMTGPPSTVPTGNWRAQALLRRHPDFARLVAPGAIHSEVIPFEGGGADAGTVSLPLRTQVPERTWKPHDRLRLVEERSELLSDFHGRDVMHGACVVVPKNYDPDREEPYPVLYWIGGFGSDHYGGRFMKSLFSASPYEDEIARVILNAQCYGGHHVFADSENNGPRMTALLEEFIPLLEEQYNLGGSGNNRFVAGHSSGGWAAMWLAVEAPNAFNGFWPLAPDPLGFGAFQTADLYAEDSNMLFYPDGTPRPVARAGETPILFMPGFVAMENVIGEGGQMRSFEWVFSPRGEDGKPIPMFDHETGVVDSEVVGHWKMYDIQRRLADEWETLSPALRGKVNIVAGGMDTFYLEKPVIELKEFFKEKGFDADVRVIEGGDHGSVMNTRLMLQIDDGIMARLTGDMASSLPATPASSTQ